MDNDRYNDIRPLPGENRYVDFDDDSGCYGVFGEESGFCYGLHFSESDAEMGIW
jgi:hypothetical protein